MFPGLEDAKNNKGNGTNEHFQDEMVKLNKENKDEVTKKKRNFSVGTTDEKNYENNEVENCKFIEIGAEMPNVVADYVEEELIVTEDAETKNSLKNNVVGVVSEHVSGVKCSLTSNVTDVKNHYRSNTSFNYSKDEEKESKSTDRLLKKNQDKTKKKSYKSRSHSQPITVADSEVYLAQQRLKNKNIWLFERRKRK